MPIIMQSIYSKQSELYNVSSFQTTYIYNPRDFLSTISALLALLPLEVVVVYLTLIYCRREVEVILIYIGQIICQLLNVHLKEKIQQPRPNPLIKGYGMPSNHAQFTSYFTGYMILWMFFRARYLPKIYYTRNTIVLAFLLISICFSRVYFKYHTIWQVIVGVLVGTAFSTICELAASFKAKCIFLHQRHDERGTPINRKRMAGLEAKTSNTAEESNARTVIILNRPHQSYQK
ncbi:hypothetical protein PNEG_01163 [Pneumocystis murina B123]|uniref:Phosphatidic acid phosphatase type 2/haloperoxidase domain-containing protein n=1 Tax=Pneumocystis murina (strain B123) TaxID=1069680 RepID=M7PJ21_PNEMU|nr:hypothetical protein PNEG_01163 [Pneumocystis murina B123]EMR10449.1 hypothetical protein PNEG_01163 [Pneumocystis murina B123]